MLVPGLSSTKRGVILGRVKGIRKDRVELELQSGLSPGDGVVLMAIELLARSKVAGCFMSGSSGKFVSDRSEVTR